MKAFVIAGTHSGVGKTTVSIGLMAEFKRRGMAVQAFKIGPDYIDPSYYALATGRPKTGLREQVSFGDSSGPASLT